MTRSRSGLRLMIFDRTQARGAFPGLSTSWKAGAILYRALGRLDATHGARSWEEALSWVATVGQEARIAEIQYWGHGKWGTALLAGERLDREALEAGHPLRELLLRIRARLVGPQALWWFRTCETFGSSEGQRFATDWAGFFGCEVAGHTYVIHLAQSGLHRLRPDQAPSWREDEGLPEPGPAGLPQKALWSRFGAPNTISCFSGSIPEGF